MANPEHVEILKKGVKEWNLWRKNNPEIVPDLSGTNFEDEEFKNTAIWNARNKRISLKSINLDGACLDKVNLKKALLDGAKLRRSSLKKAKLRSARLMNVTARHADFEGASFLMANLEKANFAFADFSGATLRYATLEGSNVRGVKFSKKSCAKKFQGIRVATCYGSQRFKTFAQDQDFIEELRSSGKWGERIFRAWWLFADCGRSFVRWAGWALLFALIFAVFFTPYPSWAPDWYISLCKSFGPSFHQTPPSFYGQPMDFWSSLYFSIVTFTTLGFGDVVADNTCARILVGMEVVLGYIMLGGLISILANKLARRS